MLSLRLNQKVSLSLYIVVTGGYIIESVSCHPERQRRVSRRCTEQCEGFFAPLRMTGRIVNNLHNP